MDENKINKIREYVAKSPKGWARWLRSKENADLLNGILNEITIPKTLSEKVYWLTHGLTDYPKCVMCGKTVKTYNGNTDGYTPHCCCSCAQKNPETREVFKKTCIELYGTDNPSKSKVVQDKMKKTCVERYGATNIFGSETGKQKIKKTNLERYGCENPQQNIDIKKKTKTTLVEKYGVTCGYHTCKDYHRSKGEVELYEFVKSMKVDARHNDKKVIWPMELDIYIPSLNIGIEYDGDYWHSLPNMVERDKLKDEVCKDKNISLIRIKESDWKKDGNTVKSYIKRRILK